MTLTFIIDPRDEHQTAIRGEGGLDDGMPLGGPAFVLADAGEDGPISLSSVLWRIAAALRSQLRGKRRRLPPDDDYLRRDIGLAEREELPHYWDFTRLDH